MEKGGIITRVHKRLFGDYGALDTRGKLRWWGDLLVKNAIFIIIALLVIYVQIYSVRNNFSNQFLSLPSFLDIIRRTGSSMFLALGVGGIIVLTGTDLSAGRVLGLTACISASLLQLPLEDFAPKMFPDLTAPPVLLVMLLVMAIGGVVGLVNGFFVSRFKLHPFIVTLASSLMVYGTLLWYVQLGRNGGGPISGLNEEFRQIVRGQVMVLGHPIPYYVFYAIAAVVIMWFIWNKSTLGKNMYAVGANPEAANVSGISVTKTTILMFMIGGILYGFSGFIDSARVGSNTVSTGEFAELDAIAACVIGGVSFTGGVGKISGIVTGVILLQVISIALQWLGVASAMQFMIKGGLILIAVAIDMRKYLAKK